MCYLIGGVISPHPFLFLVRAGRIAHLRCVASVWGGIVYVFS